jgi:hypothetical protein
MTDTVVADGQHRRIFFDQRARFYQVLADAEALSALPGMGGRAAPDLGQSCAGEVPAEPGCSGSEGAVSASRFWRKRCSGSVCARSSARRYA